MFPDSDRPSFSSDSLPGLDEPAWFSIVGGLPPSETMVRDAVAAMVVPLLTLIGSTGLPLRARVLAMLLSGCVAAGLFLLLRWRWRASQKVRVFGSVLEHSDGSSVVRVALNRAVLSVAVAPPETLVLMLDDGRSQVTVARRAAAPELLDLPPCLGPFLELSPEDFEVVRSAAQRSYPQA